MPGTGASLRSPAPRSGPTRSQGKASSWRPPRSVGRDRLLPGLGRSRRSSVVVADVNAVPRPLAVVFVFVAAVFVLSRCR